MLIGAPFHSRQLAVKAREPVAGQAKPLSSGSRRTTGLSPSKTHGPSRPGGQAKLVTPDCSCSPGAQAVSAQSFRPASIAVVQPTVMPGLSLRRSPWRPLDRIGSQGSARLGRTSRTGSSPSLSSLWKSSHHTTPQTDVFCTWAALYAPKWLSSPGQPSISSWQIISQTANPPRDQLFYSHCSSIFCLLIYYTDVLVISPTFII